MDKTLNKSLPIWQLALYFLMIGFTFISVPKSSSIYVLYARAVQTFELMFFILLLFENFKRGLRLNKFNILTNSWWFCYTTITYLFTLTMVGLTPMFKWMNVMIFLLLGTCYWRENLQGSMKYLAIVFSFLIYLNAILLIIFPDGLWIDEEWVGRGDPTRYLFGNYNQIGFVCLLGIIIQSIYTFLSKKGSVNLICLFSVSIASVLFVGSMTSTVGLIILATCILMRNTLARFSKTIVTICLMVNLLFFLFIVWYGNSIESVDLATRFIENTLSKDTSFSNRTDIWANAIYKIKQGSWIGFGVQNVDWNDTYLGGSGPHNFWLMLLLQGGYVLCFSFIYILINVIRQALNTINAATYSTLMGLCVLFVMSQLEAYNLVQVFLILQLVYYASIVNEELERMPNEEVAIP